MKSLYQAQELLLHQVPETGEESVSVRTAFGRVISQPAGQRADGEPLVKARHALTAADIAALVAAGIDSVTVRVLPGVGICLHLSDHEASVALAAAVAADWGARIESIELGQDPLQQVSAALDRLELLLIVSARPLEIAELLTQSGAEVLFGDVAIRPGGGAFALRLHGKVVLLSPDDRTDVQVVAELFLGPAIQSCQLRINNPVEPLRAELRGDLDGDPALTVLTPVALDLRNGALQARPLRPHDHPHAARAFAILPPDVPVFDRHSIVDIIPFRGGLLLYT